MTLKIKNLDENFCKIGSYEWILGDTLRDKVLDLNEPYPKIL